MNPVKLQSTRRMGLLLREIIDVLYRFLLSVFSVVSTNQLMIIFAKCQSKIVELVMQRCISESTGFNVYLAHYNAIWRLFTSLTLLFFVGRFVMILKGTGRLLIGSTGMLII